jgi:FAD/FMN-containing dehydrogenase
MITKELELEDVSTLVAQVRGTVIRPQDASYDEARHIWNGMIERRPALIVQCSGAADVMASVNFAREHDVPLSVRGGGHNVTGHAIVDGGVVIDLSRIKGVRVDPDRRRVRVGGGATLGDIDHETQRFGLAVPLGAVSKTGVAGLCLHGGLGFLTRKYGLTADNLMAADVVTADGRLLLVDEKNHPDLLWALRGGGGNFGVVVSFEFRLHPVGPEVFAGLVVYEVEKMAQILARVRDYMLQAPDELEVVVVIGAGAAAPPGPGKVLGAAAFIKESGYYR